jgi:hypothetical protein
MRYTQELTKLAKDGGWKMATFDPLSSTTSAGELATKTIPDRRQECIG